MAREVDERKTKRVLTRLQRAKEEAEARGETLSGWESDFVESVETRLKTYGSAFRDPEKGDLSEPLSGRQRQKVREIDRKARGRARTPDSEDAQTGISAPARAAKQRKPLQAKKPMNRVSAKRAAAKPGWTPRVRDISEELSGDDVPESERTRYSGPPKLRMIDGGEM